MLEILRLDSRLYWVLIANSFSRGLLYSSSIDCFKQTVSKEGFGALYKGFVPIWLRMAPWSLTFWLTYEQIVRVVGAEAW